MTLTVEDIAALIPNGAKIVVPSTRSGPALSATRALISAGVRDLHLIAMPTSGIQADMLIGAGCVKTVESAGITLDEFGQAPRFVDAVKHSTIELMDSTCPAIISAIQAGEKGIPFIPIRGLIGSDLLKFRPDYKVIKNPMKSEDRIVVLPAIRPDIALFHAPLADRFGNVWIGKARELLTMAHASHKCLITVEQISEKDLMTDPRLAPACIPSHYITGIAQAEKGTWPIGLTGYFDTDAKVMNSYADLAKTKEGFWEFITMNASEIAAQ